MGSILLKNIFVKDKPADILIEGNRIAGVFSAGGASEAGVGEIVDCTGKAAIPGFVNMHIHAAMVLMRGMGEDISFFEWIKRIWDYESVIDERYVYLATKVACLEMIRTGTTTFNDHYWHVPAAYKAVQEMGLRCNHSYVALDNFDSSKAEEQKQEMIRIYEDSKTWGSRSKLNLGYHAIYTVSKELMTWITGFARERGLKIQIHLAETQKEYQDCIDEHGVTPVQYLDSLGLLGPDVIAAHTLWLSPEDIEILGRRGVTCVHNVNSNLKLASGYRFLYSELRDAGANICIGTDGCASSNNLCLLEAMKTSAVVQKAWRNDPTAMPIDELMDCASVNGAKGLGLECGRLEEGALADIAIIDIDNTFFLSPAPMLANLIYSAHSDCVSSLICDGRFLMRDKVIPGEKEIMAEARELLNEYKSKWNI